MRKFAIYIAALAAIFFAGTLSAQEVYTVDRIPDVHRYDARRYVSDPENQLSPATVSELDRIAASIEAQTGVETAIVVVPSIGNDTPEDFAVRLFEKWGVGKKGRDEGVLILLVTQDRYIRFEVGYGLEGVLTDALSKRIQTQRMNSLLTRGDWDGGLIAGLTAIEELLTDPTSELRASETELESVPWVGFTLIVGFFIFMYFFNRGATRRARKCPRCGHQMEVVDRTSRTVAPGVKEITTYMRCPHCGYTKNTKTRQDIGGAVVGGTIAGSLGGLGRGGAGGFGGGWGGGRSGGGGATSRF